MNRQDVPEQAQRHRSAPHRMRRWSMLLACSAAVAQMPASAPSTPTLKQARIELAAKHFAAAKQLFAAAAREHPDSIDAELGLGDAELGLHEYETAELQYRKVVSQQPELWAAHKNLVIVEAALGRWEEFDRERAVLRGARERGAPGISARESDIIDTFDFAGGHWIVREYYEPVGRSLTRYNFEQFTPDGRVHEYISLESASAAAHAQAGGQVIIGRDPGRVAIHDYALNFYTLHGHGTIATYPHGEPSYEQVRAAVRRWLRLDHPRQP
jgi:tetratricopeptide (TPR) repeat protein